MIRIGAIFIPVINLHKAIDFYSTKLNMNHVGTWPNDKGTDFYFNNEKQYVTLVKVEEKQPIQFMITAKDKISYFNFTTSDIVSYRKELMHKGVKVSELVDHGPVIGFDFYDSDENMLNVITDKENVEEFYEAETDN